MVAWQKRARLAVLVVAVGVGAVVFTTTRRREPPPVRAPVDRTDPAAVVESTGGMLRDVKGGKENLRLEYEKQLTYADGSSKLIGVKITIERQGKTYVITGKEFKAGDDESHMEIDGNVHMTSNDGLDVTADSATYSEGEGIVRVPGAVKFSRGRMSGTGVDFTHDTKRDQIGLADQTDITFKPDANGSDATHITARSALLDRKDKFATFERAVHIVRSDQVIDADSGVADLTEDEKHITGLELMGTARIAMTNAAPGGLSGMSGDVINLTYVPDSEILQRATLAGTSGLRLAGEGGSAEKTLAANSVDVELAPDGATVTALNARDQVVLNLPGPKGQPSKSIRSRSLVGSGDATGLKAAVFSDNVEYRETGGAPPVQRVVTSRLLDTTLANGFSDIRLARFTGGVRFTDGATQATAADVQYQIPTGEVELNGKVGNAPPQVVDERIRVDAVKINMTLAGPKLRAAGSVSTQIKPSKPGAGGASKTRMPGIMKQDQQANGKSDSLTYDGNTSEMELIGKAILWQGDTKIQGAAIQVDGATGNLSASGGVQSWMTVQDTNVTTNVRETSVSNGTGQWMTYVDAEREVMYIKDATLVAPGGRVKGGTIAVFLGTNGQDIERMNATGSVLFTESDRRTVGEELNYVAATQEYRVSGTKDKLVQMIRREDEQCKESTGDVLTFNKGTDSLRIDGKPVTRSQTKTVACTDLPPVKGAIKPPVNSVNPPVKPPITNK